MIGIIHNFKSLVVWVMVLPHEEVWFNGCE